MINLWDPIATLDTTADDEGGAYAECRLPY